MKQLITVTLLLGFMFGCKKETLPEPINPLLNTNWRIGWAELTEFTPDTLLEYDGSTDIMVTSTYKVVGNTIHIKNIYKRIVLWDIRTTMDSSYSVEYKIINDTLYFNGKSKGAKY